MKFVYKGKLRIAAQNPVTRTAVIEGSIQRIGRRGD